MVCLYIYNIRFSEKELSSRILILVSIIMGYFYFLSSFLKSEVNTPVNVTKNYILTRLNLLIFKLRIDLA